MRKVLSNNKDYILLFIILLIIGFLRTYNEFLTLFPGVDETFLIYNHFNNGGDFFKIYYTGYLAFIPTAIGYFSNALFSPHDAILVQRLIILFSYAFTFLLLYAAKLFGKSKEVNFIFTLLVAILFLRMGFSDATPRTEIGYITNLTFSIWLFLTMHIFLLFIEVPVSKLYKVFRFLIEGMIIFSHPLTILFFPIYVYKYIQSKNKYFLLLVLTIVASYFFNFQPEKSYSSDSPMNLSLNNIFYMYEIFINQVLFIGLNDYLSYLITDYYLNYKAIYNFIIVGLVFYFLYNYKQNRVVFDQSDILLLALIIIIIGGYVVSPRFVRYYDMWGGTYYIHPRYYDIAIVILFVFLSRYLTKLFDRKFTFHVQLFSSLILMTYLSYLYTFTLPYKPNFEREKIVKIHQEAEKLLITDKKVIIKSSRYKANNLKINVVLNAEKNSNSNVSDYISQSNKLKKLLLGDRIEDIFSKYKDKIILLSAKDEASNQLPKEFIQYFKGIGSQIDTLKFRGSYVAVYHENKIIYENINNKEKITKKFYKKLGKDVYIQDLKLKKSIKLVSAGKKVGNFSAIIIDGLNYSKNRRGLNIVVMDKNFHVIDSITVDTYKYPYSEEKMSK